MASSRDGIFASEPMREISGILFSAATGLKNFFLSFGYCRKIRFGFSVSATSSSKKPVWLYAEIHSEETLT